LPSVIVELRAGMKISLILARTVRMGLLRRGLLARNDERDCVGREGEREEEKDTEVLERGSLARRAIAGRERESVSFLCLPLFVRESVARVGGKGNKRETQGRRRRGGELVGI
jgi:hypothetical protein